MEYDNKLERDIKKYTFKNTKLSGEVTKQAGELKRSKAIFKQMLKVKMQYEEVLDSLIKDNLMRPKIEAVILEQKSRR